MREIAPLRTLALRAVGPPGCHPEVTFGGPHCRVKPPTTDGDDDNKDADKNNENDVDEDDNDDSEGEIIEEPSPDLVPENNTTDKKDDDGKTDSNYVMPPDKPTIHGRLLRSLRSRPVLYATDSSGGKSIRRNDDTMQSIPLPIRPYSGAGRTNANDVDISHPWSLSMYPPRFNENELTLENNGMAVDDQVERRNAPLRENEILTMENGNHAIHAIQQFIDGLVESGRAGDTRLGVHFFREWLIAVAGDEPDFLDVLKELEKEGGDTTKGILGNGKGSSNSGITTEHQRRPNKKRRKLQKKLMASLPLGTLSLHNLSTAGIHTFRSMEKAHVGLCLGTLDLTGVHGLTDSILSNILCCNSGSFRRIQRLSIKNCRKVTGKGIAHLVKLTDLRAIDVGGNFNIHPNDVISMVKQHPGTANGTLNEIYAGGLGWTDVALESIVDLTASHLRGLGVGFSPYISGPGLALTLSKVSKTLDRLAVPFCDGMDDATAASLGRGLPNLAVLDIRGSKVTSLTGMMDGRISAGVVKFSSASGGGDGSAGDGGGDGQQQASNGVVSGHLFVLARYSGISKNSLEETLRLYDQGEILTCILDGGGIGEGIRR